MADFIDLDHSDLGLESDRFEEYPHPREMLWYGGSRDTELDLLEAHRSGKLHHAWLFTGPEGIGKATLAYRFARFLLAHPDPASAHVQAAKSLFVSGDHLVSGQVARMSHQDLAVVRRGLTKDGKSLRTEISVDEVRDALSVFRTTAGAGGWRIVIVDAADDLNRSSANALLKMLEEPPPRAIFILIAHRPGQLLPTIRSRCRVLRVPALPESAVVDGVRRIAEGAHDGVADAAAQAEGSLRQALALMEPTGAAFRRDLGKVLDDVSRASTKTLMQIVDKTTGKAGEPMFQIVLDGIERHLRGGVFAFKNQSDTASKASLAARAELWEKLRRSARDVDAYNLDRRPFLLSIFSELANIERRSAQ
ncbi:MAG: DNA polymerase III subunit delta' [Beijerinckiaceae bacterium]